MNGAIGWPDRPASPSPLSSPTSRWPPATTAPSSRPSTRPQAASSASSAQRATTYTRLLLCRRCH